jgi:RNA polymerase sigma-70 factor, ECF subfamily
VAADPAVGRADARLQAQASPEAQAAQLMFERHGDRVLAYCRRRLGSLEEAEDALQTTFLYACRGLQRGVVPETEIGWLLKIAHNVCLSHWDSDRRRRLELVRDPDRIEASIPAAAGERDDLHALETALAGLTDLQRRAILLREWRGLSYAEIAAELELSQSAVETLLFRARRALALSLEEQDVEAGRTRTRVLRGLDLGGLLAGLKSLLGGGGAAKVAAAGLTIGAAVLAGAIPDVPRGAAAEREPVPARSAPAVDPATAPSARAAAAVAALRTSEPAAPKTARAERRKPQPSERRPAAPRTSPAGQPGVGGTVEEVTSGLGGTVNDTVTTVTGTVNGTVGAVTDTVNGTVGAATGTVDDTVGKATGTVNGTVGALPQVVGPTLDVVGGNDGALLP